MGRLDDIDLSATTRTASTRSGSPQHSNEFQELRLHLGGQIGDAKIGPGLLVVIEGADAGGKGGATRRIVERLDPRHFDVYAYAKPTEREKRHHFLWRFWSKVPGLGGMCVFDRSWYGRCSSSASRSSPRSSSGPGPTTRSSSSNAAWCSRA
jgi:AMP-polyphosphate phosphotransferase